jgi:hypothetical protein
MCPLRRSWRRNRAGRRCEKLKGLQMNPWHVVPFVLLPIALAGCNREQSAPADGGQFHIDFRTEPNYELSFRLADAGQREFVTTDAQGLRIALPGGMSQPVGIVLVRDIRGDFGATIHYELVHAEAGRDWGSGFQVFLQLDNPGGDGLTIARQARGPGQSVLFQHMTTRDNKRVPVQTKVIAVEDAVPAGTFAVRREGSQLAVKYGVGAGPPDQELGRFEVGEAPVATFRLSANPEARGKFPVEARVLDLDLSAVALPAEPVRRPPALLITFIVASALLVGVAVFAAVRRRLARRPAADGLRGGES